MKLGVFYPTRSAHSVLRYTDNVMREIELSGVSTVCFSENDPLPYDVDLYWDPRAAGGVAPYRVLKTTTKPFVVTVHGAAPFALPSLEYFPNLYRVVLGKLQNIKKLYDWRAFHDRYAFIITVSTYAKGEIEEKLGLKREMIVPIHHGVDHALFKPAPVMTESVSYFLHVSAYQPKKNVDRIINAYQRISRNDKPRLVLVVPGYPGAKAGNGIKLVCTSMSHNQLVSLYQGAMGFVFPSLHETFGMPIIEAMSSGCPVITSDVSACPEVAGDAALLVNPRSTDAIAKAMCRLIDDQQLRQQLRKKGLKRSARFTWHKSAEKHLEVFKIVLRKKV